MRRRLLGSVSAGGGINPSQSVACDICFYDRTTDSLIIADGDTWNSSTYPSSRYTPIGVVVVPGSHNVYGDGSCGVMSLREMRSNLPDSGSSASYQGMYWGGSGDNTSLRDLDQVPTGNTSNGFSTGYNQSGCLPSNKFSGTQCAHDIDAYYESSPYIPSPYLTDGSRNPGYHQTLSPSSPNNALNDFDGIGNSQVLWDLAISQGNWKDEGCIIINSSSSGYYPAACCCWRYHTEGTQQGDWYLPACGELGYIIPKFNEINDAIYKMRATYGPYIAIELSTDGYYWSSTEYNINQARRVYTGGGDVEYNYKGNAFYVRAFLRVK